MQANQLWNRLINALQLLAADYAVQRKAIPSVAHLPDELALIYTDCLLCVERSANKLMNSSILSESALRKLRQLDDALEYMSGEPNLWTIDALIHSSEWSQVRMNAREILRELGIPPQTPQLDWISYLPASASDTNVNNEKL